MKTMKFRRTLLVLMLMALTMSAVTGGTIAWFTDSVESANNVITSGNLDIELDYWNGTAWDTVKGKSDILTNTLWEPGVAEVAYLRVKNAGSLALKYRLGINVVDETKGTNVDEQEFALSDHIEFGLVEGVNGETGAYTNRADAIAAVTEAKKLSAGYTKFAAMNAGDPDQYLALVVYMPTTVGNEANHKTGTAAPTINLGINVEATQLVAESDSFGPDYDVNAWESWGSVGAVEVPTPDENGVVTVSTAEQLAGVMQNFAGVKTINIVANIDLGGRKWVPAFVTAPDLVINGNGHVISNMTTDGANNVGFIGAAYQNITIKDLTFKNAKVEATGSFVGGVIGNAWDHADITLYNVDLVDSEVSTSIPTKAIRLGGLIGYSPYTRGDLTLKDCDVTGSTFAGYHNVGAMVGTMMFYGPEQGSITVENCTAKKNTLKYGSPSVGAFAFGASTSGYTEYQPAGFTAEDNKTVAIVNVNADLNTLINKGATEIELPAGEFTADFYSASPNRKLTITGQGAATKLKFANLQARLELFDELTISNCTIERMPNKGWGHLVFGSSTQAGGKYTISNCIFNGVGSQGIYINQNVPATFNIENCTFNGDFGGEGAITIQNNDGVNITVNVTDCSFNNIPATSHEICVLYAYDGWKLNADGVDAFWKAK